MLSSKIPLRWGLGCCLRMLPSVSPVTERVLCSREAQQVCFPLVPSLCPLALSTSDFTQKISDPKLYWCSPPVRGAGFSGKRTAQGKLVEGKALTVPQSFTFLPLLCLPWVTDWISQCLNSGQKSPSQCEGDHARLAFCHVTFPMSISYQLPFPKPKHLHYSTCFITDCSEFVQAHTCKQCFRLYAKPHQS